VSFFGTDTTIAVDNAHNGANGTDGSVDNPTVSLTSTADGCWFLEVYAQRIAAGETITQGAESGRTDWSPDWEYEPGGNEIDAGGTYYSDVTPAGSKTFSWTTTAASQWGLSAVAIRPAAKAHPALMAGPAAWCP